MKALIFDADGMIVHGDRFSSRLAREYGIPLEITAPFFKNVFPACLIGKADLRKELSKYIGQWGWNKSIDDLFRVWFDEAHNRIDMGLIPIIEESRGKGVKCYLATNNEKYRTENLVRDRGLGEWFDGVFSSADIGSKKPEQAFFEGIFRRIPENKEDVIFWDDDLENIEGAKAYGLTAEIYTDIDSFKKRIEEETRR